MSEVVEFPRHWRWHGFLVDEPVRVSDNFRRLIEATHGPAIYVPQMGATLYWPRPLHLPMRWLHKAYVWWLWHFIFPLARHVLGEGKVIWKPLRWPLEVMERSGEAPTVRLIADDALSA